MFAKIAAKRRGFTLIELLVVIVIIAVLALIAIPKFQDAGLRSKEASLKSDLSLLRSAIATCQTDTGLYPASLSDLTSATAPATSGYDKTGTAVAFTAADWHGPYLQGSVPTDPVATPSGTAFTYTKTTGTVASPATGNGLDGKAYSSY